MYLDCCLDALPDVFLLHFREVLSPQSLSQIAISLTATWRPYDRTIYVHVARRSCSSVLFSDIPC